jgi:ribonuclease D
MNHVPSMIETSDALSALADNLRGQEGIAIDTEFMREKTYRAELCLLQLASGDRIVCVDPLAVPDLKPLRMSLCDESSVKIMHAARQDLEVLLPAVGLVRPVFDTQIAAALAGFAAQIGYGELVRRLLERELPKAHTRADWSRRPLSPEQIEYALDDVRYLGPLREQLQRRIDLLGRSAWLDEELAQLGDESALRVEPADAWRKLKGLNGLDEPRVALTRELCAWRERRAIARNRPRGWIIDDAVLREIVLRVPRSRAALAAVAEMPESVMRNCGDELLELLAASKIADPPPPPPRRERPDATQIALVKRLVEVTAAIATELELSAEVLATRRDLEQVAQGKQAVSVLSGWRRAVLGDRLLAAL